MSPDSEADSIGAMDTVIEPGQVYLDHEGGFAGVRRHGFRVDKIWIDEDGNAQIRIAESQLTGSGFWDHKSELRADSRTVTVDDIRERLDRGEIELVE